MSRDDWYRRKTWTTEDREAFHARLRRSRGGWHKAQYACIQAGCLREVGTPELLRAAIELLDLVHKEWFNDYFPAWLFNSYALCHGELGEHDHAVEYYRKTFDAQRIKPNIITNAHLDLGWLCVTVPLPRHYSEVMEALDEFLEERPMFPNMTYADAAIRAIIHDTRGERQPARDHAARALEAAAITKTELRHHPTLGLVEKPNLAIHRRLQAIVQ